MDKFLCKIGDKFGVVGGENRADAILRFDALLFSKLRQNIVISQNYDGSSNDYCEVLLAEHEVTELHRHDVLEWVERKLDGDNSISIML
jgi:hypothetical protein